MEKIKVYGSHVVDSLGSETGNLYKGQTIIFSPGNFSTIDSALANCFPPLTAQTIFLIPQILHNRGSLCRQFFQMHL